MTIKYRELRRRYELDGAARTTEHLSEALRERHLKPEDFSVRDLAEGLVPHGHEWVRMLDPRSAGGVSLLEAADGVDTTAFLNITGQVIYSKIMQAYEQEAFVVSKLVDTIPTRPRALQPRPRKPGGSWGTSKRRLPTWRTGRSR